METQTQASCAPNWTSILELESDYGEAKWRRGETGKAGPKSGTWVTISGRFKSLSVRKGPGSRGKHSGEAPQAREAHTDEPNSRTTFIGLLLAPGRAFVPTTAANQTEDRLKNRGPHVKRAPVLARCRIRTDKNKGPLSQTENTLQTPFSHSSASQQARIIQTPLKKRGEYRKRILLGFHTDQMA